eukprot:c29091_g1_i1 orf=710-5935(-)
MKVPLAAQEGLNCRTSEVLLRQRLGDLYLQFIGTDRTSKTGGHEGECAASRAGNLWHCETSEISASSTQDVMVSQSDMEGSSKKSSAALRSAEFPVVLDVDSATDRLQGIARKDQAEKGEASSCRRLSEDFYSGEVNPETYDVAVAASRRWNGRGGIESSSSACAFSAIVKQSDDLDLSSPQRAQAEGGLGFPNDGEPKQLFEFGPDAFSQSGSHVRDLPRMNAAAAAHRVPSQRPRVKLMCSFAGSILPRPYDGKLRYVGGETRIIGVNRDIRYTELMYKLTEFYGVALTLKYQLPDEDLDALISVSSDDDLQNMMEEYDKLEAAGGFCRLRVFLFSADEFDVQLPVNTDEDDSWTPGLQYVDSLDDISEIRFKNLLENAEDLRFFDTRNYCTTEALPARIPSAEDSRTILHQPVSWHVQSTQTSSAAPSATSSTPSSPSVPSRQAHIRQQVALPDSSLGPFQDRLKRLTVHPFRGTCKEACFQDLDQTGSGRFYWACQCDHCCFPEPQMPACISPRVISPDIAFPRRDHLRTVDVGGQKELHGTLINKGHELMDQVVEIPSPPDGHDLALLQQQQLLLSHPHPHQLKSQQQQAAWLPPVDPLGELHRIEKAHHHSKDAHVQALQPSLGHAACLHSCQTYSDHYAVSRQRDNELGTQEVNLRGTNLPGHVPSHSRLGGPQPSYGLSSASAYHKGSAPSSPRIVVQDCHNQHPLQVRIASSGCLTDHPYGGQLHCDDKSDRSFGNWTSPFFGGNVACADEPAVTYQQLLVPLAVPEARLEERAESCLQCAYGRVHMSQCQFPDSLASPLSLQADAFLPLHEPIKTNWQTVRQEKNNDALTQQQFHSQQPHPSLRRQAPDQTSFHPGNSHVYDRAGDWVDLQINQVDQTKLPHGRAGCRRQPAYEDEGFGRDVGGGKCIDRVCCNFPGEDIDDSIPLVGDLHSTFGSRDVWSESSDTLPMNLFQPSWGSHGADISGGLLPERLQLSESSYNLKLSESNQLSRVATSRSTTVNDLGSMSVQDSTCMLSADAEAHSPSGLCSWPEEKSSEFGSHKTEIPSSSLDNIANNGSVDAGTAVDALNVFSGFHRLGDNSVCLGNLLQYEGPSEFGFHVANLSASSISADAKNEPADLLGAQDIVNTLFGSDKLEEPALCVDLHLGNLDDCNHSMKTSEMFAERGQRENPNPEQKVLDEKATGISPVPLLQFECTQSNCSSPILERKFPYTVCHDGLPNVSDCAAFSTSMVAAARCPSAQMVPGSYQWDGFCTAAATVGGQDDALSAFNLPIYDRSPVGSLNTDASRDFYLDLDEATRLTQTSPEDALAGRMSVTGRLAEDMVCSVLESCGRELLCDATMCDVEAGHERPECGKYEDTQFTTGDFETSVQTAALQETHETVDQAECFFLENENADEASQVVSELGLEAYKDKDLEKGVNGSDEAGQNGAEIVNHCVYTEAEAEALALGLQTIKDVDLEEIRELGSGTFGTVYYGKWRGSDVAIKRLKASCFAGSPSEQVRLLSDFWREACTLGQLHHPNVVAFYGVVRDGPGGTLATVTEYMVNGSLKQVLQKKDRTIDRRKRLLIAMDAAFGMEYLHSKSIVHFDLKCENLLVNMRDPLRPICKVGDFGLSKVKHHTLVSGGVRGTLPWMAPELLSGNNSLVTEKIDVFSFGIVMWELLTGEEPYANMHCGAIIGGITNNSLRPSIPCWCDPSWRSLMERCWADNISDRPSFSEVASELRAIAASINLK